MIQLWKKLSRCIRKKTGLAIGMVIIFSLLVLRSIPTGQSHTLSSRQYVTPSPAAISHTDKFISTPAKKPESQKVTTSKPIYISPLKDGRHVNPYPFRFTMRPHGCTNEDLVIVVHSAAQYFVRRDLMRSTWLNRHNLESELSLKVKTVFIVGKTLNESVQHHLNYEQEMYDDIVQSNFIDSYQNNTYKAISFMRWVSSKNGCSNASVLLKVDDDALIHPVKISKLNKTIHRALEANSTDVYLGRMLTTLVNRNNASKWCVSWELWPHEFYPVWFQGLAYLLTPSLAAKLPAIALDVKYMFTDDVYVGVLVSQVEGAEVIAEDLFGIHTEGPLDKFFRSYTDEGRIFYHVPSISHFISWYYVNGELIHMDPALPTTTPSSIFSHKISSSNSGFIFLPLAILPFVIMIIIGCCVTCNAGSDVT